MTDPSGVRPHSWKTITGNIQRVEKAGSGWGWELADTASEWARVKDQPNHLPNIHRRSWIHLWRESFSSGWLHAAYKRHGSVSYLFIKSPFPWRQISVYERLQSSSLREVSTMSIQDFTKIECRTQNRTQPGKLQQAKFTSKLKEHIIWWTNTEKLATMSIDSLEENWRNLHKYTQS